MCFHARLAFSAAAELRPYYVYIYIYTIYMYTYTSSFRSSPTTTYSSMYCWLLLYGKLERDSLQYRHFCCCLLRRRRCEERTSRRLDCHGTNSIQCTCWLLHIYCREELSLYFGIMREQNELTYSVDRIYLRIIILDLLFLPKHKIEALILFWY